MLINSYCVFLKQLNKQMLTELAANETFLNHLEAQYLFQYGEKFGFQEDEDDGYFLTLKPGESTFSPSFRKRILKHIRIHGMVYSGPHLPEAAEKEAIRVMERTFSSSV